MARAVKRFSANFQVLLAVTIFWIRVSYPLYTRHVWLLNNSWRTTWPNNTCGTLFFLLYCYSACTPHKLWQCLKIASVKTCPAISSSSWWWDKHSRNQWRNSSQPLLYYLLSVSCTRYEEKLAWLNFRCIAQSSHHHFSCLRGMLNFKVLHTLVAALDAGKALYCNVRRAF